MASESMHYRRLVITPSQKQQLMNDIRKRSFDLSTKSGYFIQTPDIEGELPVRLIHSKAVTAKALVVDESRDDHLEFEKREWEISSATDICFDFNNDMIYVQGSAAGFKFLEESLEDMDANFTIEKIQVDLKEILESVRETYTTSMVKSVGVKNYVGKHGMKTSGTFKSTKDSDSLDFVEEFSSSMVKWQLQCEYAEEKFKLTATDKGSLSISGNAPSEVAQLFSKLFEEHNLAAVVTAEEEQTQEKVVEGEPELKLVPSSAPPPPPAPIPQTATVG